MGRLPKIVNVQTPGDAKNTYLPSTIITGTGIDPTGTTDSAAAIQAFLTAGANKELFLPIGTYRIDSGLTMLPTTSLRLADGTTVKAGAAIAGPMLTCGNSATRWANRMLVGGTWDCNGLAETGVSVKTHLNVALRDFNILGQTKHALILGDVANPTFGNEARLSDIKVDRTPATTPPVGYYGIWVNAYDAHINKCIVVGAETSFRADGDANKFVQCHGWGYGGKLPTVIFDDNGFNNEYIGCKADSPSQYGYLMQHLGWRILGGEIFNGPVATDGVIGIHTTIGSPTGSIVGVAFNGTGAHPLAQDYDGAIPNASLVALGCTGFNVTAQKVSFFDYLRSPSTNGPLRVQGDNSGCRIFSGSADPNGAVTAMAGDLYLRSSPLGPTTRIYQSAGTTVWTALDTGPQVQVFTGGTAAAGTRTATVVLNDVAIPTFYPGRAYKMQVWARDTTTGTRATAECQFLVSSEGAGAVVTLCSVDNKLGALFGLGAGVGTYGVSLAIDATGQTLSASIKNNSANSTQFGFKVHG